MMIENVVEVDDDLMEKYLEGEELSDKQIETTLLKGIKSGLITPVLCGAAVLNMGVSQLMDLVVDGLPSPVEKEPRKGTVPGTDEETERAAAVDAPFSALVFKTVADPLPVS